MTAAAVGAFFAQVSVKLAAGMKTALRDTGAFHTRTMTRRFKPYGSGDPIQTRSGALRRSFGFEYKDDLLRIFSAGTPYARIQEYGGVVRPKNKRYLTIPLPDALTPAGVLKGGARLVPHGNKYETADGEPTFIFRSKRGNLLVATRDHLLYVLKPSVTLKPRLGFRETFQKLTLPFLRTRTRRALEEAVSA